MMRRFSTPLVLFVCLFLLAPHPGAQTPFRILVTNDDGIRAPGIVAVAQALTALGEVTVVAPSENQSAKGHALAIADPVYADKVQFPGGLTAFSLTATPATCVKLALGALLPQKPDLVVSGINRDQNLGMVAYISGTVAGAREAALQGIPAIAVSLLLGRTGELDYGPAAHYTLQIATAVKERGLEPGTFLNVNVPAGPAEAIKGIRVTTQSALAGTETFIEHARPPMGRRYFWNTYDGPHGGAEGDDVWAVYQGYVAVTPLRVGEFDRKTYEAWKGILK